MLHCAGAGRVLIRRVLGLRHHVTIGRSIDFDQCRTRPSATLAKVDRSASSASRVLVHRCRPRSTSPDVRHRSGPSFSLRLSSSCPQEDGHGNPLRVQEDAAVAAVSLATGGCHVRPSCRVLGHVVPAPPERSADNAAATKVETRTKR